MCKYLYPPWINNFGNFGRVEPSHLIEKDRKKSKKIKIKSTLGLGSPIKSCNIKEIQKNTKNFGVAGWSRGGVF